MSKSKRQQIKERQRKQKIRSYLAWGAAGLAVAGLIGFYVFKSAGQPAPIGEKVDIPANYINHVEEGTDPGPFPSDPPAGGSHYANEFDAGFYNETSPQAQVPYPAGYLGHNLEHGYVIFWYNCEIVSENECSTMKAEIQSVMNDFGGIKLIAFPWSSLDVPVAMTSWGRVYRFDSFDPKTAAAFIEANRNKSPEPNAQ